MTKKNQPKIAARISATREKPNSLKQSSQNQTQQSYQSKPVAKATHQVTGRASAYGLQTLQDHELRSIYTLFSWVSNEQHAARETVQSMTEARFGIDDVTKLRKRDYDDVIRFLVDLRIDEMKH